LQDKQTDKIGEIIIGVIPFKRRMAAERARLAFVASLEAITAVATQERLNAKFNPPKF
jgi:hypothetical protein